MAQQLELIEPEGSKLVDMCSAALSRSSANLRIADRLQEAGFVVPAVVYLDLADAEFEIAVVCACAFEFESLAGLVA